ncbi:hypothetical protein Taro_049998 [Colocasia esculenta]|uniref:Uncharacterized protein n=1 Tax=Colocasia esculenta TaxID=4460 RepID=A0A843XCP2_COLES|nr:hypothetical protein [Colocasia esculenta]
MSEVQGGSACGPLTLWRSEVVVPVVRQCFSCGCSVSLVVTPNCSFLTSWRCVPRCCFHIVFDSASAAGVVLGPTLVSSFASALLEFLLLRLVGTRCRRSSLPDSRGDGLFFMRIQTRFYEELSSSGRPEEGKEVSLIISRTRRERDRGQRCDKRRVSHDDHVIRSSRGSARGRDRVASELSIASTGVCSYRGSPLCRDKVAAYMVAVT